MKLYRYLVYFVFKTVFKMRVRSTIIQIQRPNYTNNSVEKSSFAMLPRMQAAYCAALLPSDALEKICVDTQFAFSDRMYRRYLFICSEARHANLVILLRLIYN